MKNTGLTLAITVAILALLAGGYFMWKKESVEPALEVNNTEDTNRGVQEDMEMEVAGSPTPSTGSNTEATSQVDIDAELKNLDTDMNSAFQNDSDSDPTTEIE